MIDCGKLNIGALVEHYALANTPRYLYRHIRSEVSVEALAAAATVDEILAEIDLRTAKSDRATNDVALAYALLVSLSFKNIGEVRSAVAAWERPGGLIWVDHILSIINQTAIVTSLFNMSAKNGSTDTAYPQTNITSSLITLS